MRSAGKTGWSAKRYEISKTLERMRTAVNRVEQNGQSGRKGREEQ